MARSVRELARGKSVLEREIGFKAKRDRFGTRLPLAAIAALSLSLAALPANAAHRAKKTDETPVDPAALAAAAAVKNEPMTLVVSLGDQTVDVYRGTTLLASSHVSTGRAGHTTKAGIFSVLQKQRYHYSNMYGSAPMPWMQRITWSGTALHAGYVPNYPASHGCIRLPQAFAIKLWGMTEVGVRVVVSRSNPKPELIDNPNLFQPLPTPTPPVMAKNDEPQPVETADNASAMDSASPVILASAEMGSGSSDAVDKTPAADQPAVAPNPATSDSNDEAPGTHAIAATAAASLESAHAIGAPDPSSGGHAIDINAAETSMHAISEAAVPASTDHADQLPHPPSAIDKKAIAGTEAAAIQAAEPKSDAPLEILITKTSKRDRIMGVQYQLAALGYLKPQQFDGTFGIETINAIKKFQKDHDMPVTGAVTDDVVNKIYAVNGNGHPTDGHLYVRRNFDRVFDAPISYKDPDQPLGAHLFTALDFKPGDTKTRWIAVNTNGSDPNAALDRIEIPAKIRQWISQRLTPGSSLIVADTSINTAMLRKGADFVVLANDPGAPAVSAAPAQPRVSRYQQQVPDNYYAPRRRGSAGGGFWFSF
jgi:peptidoglycan hydrolase-like protein with peptidoglycan-binding domain